MVHRLEEAYRDRLLVIGVHAGKFHAERVTENIRTATRRLGITHPVVNDRQFRTWRAYGVQAWPTVALVSPDGNYIGQHAGEFTFDQFDELFEALVETYTQVGLLTSEPLSFASDPEPATDSPLRFPGKVLADAAHSRLFIADTGHNRVLVAELGEDGVSARATHAIGSGRPGMRDGGFHEAQLHGPQGTALSPDGSILYIADTENHSIRAADLLAGTVQTIAGTGEQGYTRSGGAGKETALNSPWDLLLRDGWLYIAMAGTHQLWRMNLETEMVGPFVGSGRENIDDGPNPRATLAQPSGLATDGQRLLFADSESSAIRAADFSPDGYTQTLVGQGLFEFGDRDGPALEARLQHCLGVAYREGKVYMADTYNNKIKLLDLSTRQVTTALGSGDREEMYEPGGISFFERDGQARLYIADTNNHKILCAAVDEEGTLSAAQRVLTPSLE